MTPFILPSASATLTDAAITYAALGFRVIPVYGVRQAGDAWVCQCGSDQCKNVGKHPITPGWQRRGVTTVADVTRDRKRYPDANIGLAMGDCGLGHLVCIDIDKPEAWEELVASLPSRVPATLESRSGRGRHLFFVAAPGQDVTRLGNKVGLFGGVDVRGAGGQVLAAPSVHRSGVRYQWVTTCKPAELPPALYDAIATPPRPALQLVSSQSADQVTDARHAAADEAYVQAALSNACVDIARCAEGSRNATLNKLASVVFQYAVSLGWSEARACEPIASAAISAGLELGEVRATVSSAWRYAQANPRPIPEPKQRAALIRGTAHELKMKTRKGEAPVVSTVLANAVDILQVDARWSDRIHFDQFAERLTVIDPPWHSRDAAAVECGKRLEWTDSDDARLQSWLTREYGVEFPISTCRAAVEVVAENHGYHPVREYLDALEWDGVDRCCHLFSEYFGATGNEEYLAAISVRWLVSAVARIYDPGCKVDTLPILEGPQGLRKSSALRALGGEWFSDTPLPIGEKDAFEQLKGRWIIELAELDSLSKADASAIKAFISSQVDTYRGAYKRRAVSVPRSCVFAGSVNPEGGYLKDATGNRRFWPVECGAIDLERLQAERDQLWAEAKVRYRAGERWWIDTESLEQLCKDAQEERYQVDEWEPVIATWLKRNKGYHTTVELMRGAFGMNAENVNRSVQMRASSIMKRLGFNIVKVSRDGDRVRVWAVQPSTPVQPFSM